jgi:hypothetical protein
MNLNHSAEYVALWKSRKRAQWEAARLSQEANSLHQQLQQKSQQMWQLSSELGAELERVAATLTPGQRKTAEKMLKQWEQEEEARSQQV